MRPVFEDACDGVVTRLTVNLCRHHQCVAGHDGHGLKAATKEAAAAVAPRHNSAVGPQYKGLVGFGIFGKASRFNNVGYRFARFVDKNVVVVDRAHRRYKTGHCGHQNAVTIFQRQGGQFCYGFGCGVQLQGQAPVAFQVTQA